MSEILQRYRKRADDFERKVAAVKPDQWSNPSPCDEWDARGVVEHIVDMHAVMLRPLDRSLSPAPSVADDPLSAFVAARADIEAVLDDPELASTDAPTPIGSMTVEDHIDQVVSADMVLHGWDLARATGQDETIDPDEIEPALRSMDGLPEHVLRQPGVFAPKVEVPDDASPQDKLLAFLGRDPR